MNQLRMIKQLKKYEKVLLEETNFTPYTIDEIDFLDAKEKENKKLLKLFDNIEKCLITINDIKSLIKNGKVSFEIDLSDNISFENWEVMREVLDL